MVQIVVRCSVAVVIQIIFVREGRVLEHVINGIDSEAVRTTLQPIFQNFQHLRVNVIISVVQVGLLGRELMQVALPSSFVISPSWCVENCNLIGEYIISEKRRR